MAGKKSKGRQRIEMKLIANESQRLVTFSKRKAGINKKLSEVVTNNGAEVLFVVFSPAGKPSCYGSPSVESVSSRFLGEQDSNPDNDPTRFIEEARRRTELQNQINEYNEMLNQVRIIREKGKVLHQKLHENNIQMEGWWNCNVDDLNSTELREMATEFKKLCHELCDKVKEKDEAVGASFASFLMNKNDNPSTSGATGTGSF